MENIIEYLVPLIFILAYVFPKIKKSKQKKNQPSAVETKSQKDGLLSKLTKMVEEYSESDREVVKEEKEEAESYDWYGDRPEDEDEDTYEEEPKKPSIEVTEPQPETKTDSQVIQKVKLPPKDQQLIFRSSAKSLYVSSNVNKKELRKAIVWSEILSPPKALRDE